MDACDACGLSRTAKDYGWHNCFAVIKQLGRSELAIELLADIGDDSCHVVREILVAEKEAMPLIEQENKC